MNVPATIDRSNEGPTACSESAFVGLVAAHHDDLVRLAYAMLGDPDHANDVAQATWAAAWRHRSRLREPDKVRGWLLTITANEARRAMRRQRVLRWVPLIDEGRPAPTTTSPDDAIDLVTALQRLPARDREILARRYALGETSQEIAAQVGMSDSGVRVRISRLLNALREDLLK